MPRIKHNNPDVNLNLNVRNLDVSATLAINERVRELRTGGREIFNFGLGQSPFPVPRHVVEALQRNAYRKEYLAVQGLPDLRDSVAAFNRRTQNVQTLPENVMIGPGSKELIFILQLVYYGDLLIPVPSWVSYAPQARIIGRNVFWVPTRKENFWRLSPEELEKICQKDPERPRVLILNYPSNPTGYTYPTERLKLLAEVARKYKVIVISDEIYGMLHHKGQHVSIARFYPEGTVISGGLSKWCGAGGWRLGTFSFPSNLTWILKAMCVVASETYTSTSTPIQYAAVDAFSEEKHTAIYLQKSRLILRTIGKYLIREFEKMGIKLQLPHGGFYLFPDFEPYREKLKKKGITTSPGLCSALLEETGIAMLPGSDFGVDPNILVSRISYVDFDGKMALDAVRLDSKEDLPGNGFISAQCPNIKSGFERLGNWILEL